MGACTSAQDVGLKDKNAIKPKAQIRQTSSVVTAHKEPAQNGTIANNIKAR